MTDPVTTLTAFAIAKFAFKKFFESGVGKLGEKFTETALTKMDELRQKIWDKLRGNPRAEKALQETEKGSEEDLQRLAIYLEDEMKDDPEFAAEIRAIAHEININRVQDNSSQTQNIYGGKGYQTKMGDNNTNQFGDTHNYYGTPPQP
ncbi:hypothetical protein H6G93_21985 [Nostoc sp. FACHB-973]|nr:hypothetical protein [Nostoc sp. FACHB-973]